MLICLAWLPDRSHSRTFLWGALEVFENMTQRHGGLLYMYGAPMSL